jgi:predicted transcriptional regulator YdeE
MRRPIKGLGQVMIISTAVGCALALSLAEGYVKPRIIQLDAFEVMGIEARTNNAAEAGPNGVIPKLWQRVVQQHALDGIPDRLDQNIYAVYTDYASDANRDYTLVLGAKVRPGTKTPDGMIVKTVPSGRYAVFTSDVGPVAKVVVQTWKQIWSYYQSPVNGQRSYRADFEVYDQRAADPNHAQVDIYIGMK